MLWLPITKKNKIANEYFGEFHALCFSENRNEISRIYPKLSDFIQFVYFLAELGIKIQLHLFWLKQVIWKYPFRFEKAMFIKIANSANNGSIRTILSPKWLLESPLSGKNYHFMPLKGPGSNGLTAYLWQQVVKTQDLCCLGLILKSLSSKIQILQCDWSTEKCFNVIGSLTSWMHVFVPRCSTKDPNLNFKLQILDSDWLLEKCFNLSSSPICLHIIIIIVAMVTDSQHACPVCIEGDLNC